MNILNHNTPIIIGIDHGYGNIKTANCYFKTGVASFDKEPTFPVCKIANAVDRSPMLAFGLRVLYAGENLDGAPVPLLPGGGPAPGPGPGGRPDRPRPRGDADLSPLRTARPPGRAAALLFHRLRPGRAPSTKAFLYSKKTGLMCGKLGPEKSSVFKAFQTPNRGGAYHFTSCPCFPLILSTFQVLKGGYHGRKSRLCDPAIRPV